MSMKGLWSLMLVAAVAVAVSVRAEQPPATASEYHWYRGNTHTHTPFSVGERTLGVLAESYRKLGYDFVVVTDHELLTEVSRFNGRYQKDGTKFLLIRGQEVTQSVADPSRTNASRAAHMNGINTNKVIMPLGYEGEKYVRPTVSMAEAYRRNLGEIRAAGGIPQVNHPNYIWSVRYEHLEALPSPYLMEIWNGLTTINNLGGCDDKGDCAPSTEELWDRLLTAGRTVWGVGSDDAHEYFALENMRTSRPGKAWVVVRAKELSTEAVTAAFEAGQFYASNGIVLDDYSVTKEGISIAIKDPSYAGPRYRTRFIGRDGKVLAEASGTRPSYAFRGDEMYVRASIIDSDGTRAWTQPVFFDRRRRE